MGWRNNLGPSNEKEQPDWKLFTVCWHVDATGWEQVWAKDAEHAKELAQGAEIEHTELGDSIDIVEVYEANK